MRVCVRVDVIEAGQRPVYRFDWGVKVLTYDWRTRSWIDAKMIVNNGMDNIRESVEAGWGTTEEATSMVRAAIGGSAGASGVSISRARPAYFHFHISFARQKLGIWTASKVEWGSPLWASVLGEEDEIAPMAVAEALSGSVMSS